MTNQNVCRRLKPEEFEKLEPLAREFTSDATVIGKINMGTFLANWKQWDASGLGAVFGLFKDDCLVGMLGGLVFPDPNNGTLIATELFWFVSKNHRGGGMALLNQFEAWSEEMGARRIIMVYLFDSMPEVVKKIYEKQGYKPLEVHYVKEVN